jgi:hypothetical protein
MVLEGSGCTLSLSAQPGRKPLLRFVQRCSGADRSQHEVERIPDRLDGLPIRHRSVAATGFRDEVRTEGVARHWMIAMTAALAEAMHLCTAMGLDQQQFIELLDGGPLGSAYGLLKLDEMRRHDYPAGFPVRLALKDLELVREVEQNSKAAMPLLDVVHERFLTAREDHADEDLAAVYEVGRPD